MKKLSLFAALALVSMLFASCGKIEYKSFVGTWGVEKIEYYNIDYAGNPIPASMESYNYDPNDTDNGIQLIFREDQTGEMRDSDIDSLAVINSDNDTVYIHCPDTTLVYPFTCSFDKKERVLYTTMDYGSYILTFRMYVSDMTANSFIYENEYDKNYMEKAYLKRLSNSTSKSASRTAPKHPRKPGSFLGGR